MTQFLATRTQVVALVVVLLAALGVLGAIGWISWSARAAAQVTTSWELDCPGTRLGQHEGSPAIWSRPGWRCDVAIRVVNDSDREVHVTGVSGREVGTDAGSEARALPAEGAPLDPADSLDALWNVDATVPAHESRTVTVAVGWREEGCNNSLGYLTVQPWATVHVQTLGRDHDVTSDQPLVLRTFRDAHDRRACGEAAAE